MNNNLAVIFDMDGVLVDNYQFHQKAWETFCQKYQLEFTAAFRSEIFGGTNRDHLETFFSRRLTDKEIARYETEKESIYRSIYAKSLQPVAGLIPFLKLLRESRIPIALATSSPTVNVGFVLSGTNTLNYFNYILDASNVKHGKPEPEIYLKAVALLNRKPEECVVFEDSVNGILSASRAGTNVVALTTTHSREELPAVKMAISNFDGLTMGALKKLL